MPRKAGRVFSLEATAFIIIVCEARREHPHVLYVDTPEINQGTVYAHVWRLRAKLKPFGIHISCGRGTGYRLVGREKVQAMMARTK